MIMKYRSSSLIDTTTKQIMASYQSTVFEDAAVQVYANSLLLDTAAYQLAPSVRAFGLRFDSLARVPSCAEGWQGGKIQLFVREGVALRPVFAIPVNHLLVSNGCINAGTGMDTLYEEANLTVKVLKSRANGYADLMLNAVINTDGSDPKAQTIKPRVEQQLMQYDGEKYVASKKHAPWWLGSNWALQ